MLGLRVLDPGNTVTTRYFQTDNLGSITVITDESGNVVERNSYDAWGKRRFPDGADDPSGNLTSQTTRGYTGQEQLTDVGLVHLNGRVYDPLVGRMMSADPFVPDPTNGQAWNRYSYVINNPLALTDTNGYCFLGMCSWGKAIGTFLTRSIGAVFRAVPILGTLLEIAASAVLCGPAEAVCLAAVAFAATTFVNGVTSGNWGKALRAGLIAGITAGLTSTAFSMANEIMNSATEAAAAGASASGLPADAMGYANPAGYPEGTMYGPPECPTCFIVNDHGTGSLYVNVTARVGASGAGAGLGGGAYEYIMGITHAALTAASFLPSVAGAAFSALDGGLYAAQGDYKSAGIAIAAAGIGMFADAGAARLALTAAAKGTAALGKGTAGAIKGLGNIGSHGVVDAGAALSSGQKWLGAGYKEIAPGVFRSADGLRQFRMTNADLLATHGNIGSHVHFEALNELGKVIENLHLPVTP